MIPKPAARGSAWQAPAARPHRAPHRAATALSRRAPGRVATALSCRAPSLAATGLLLLALAGLPGTARASDIQLRGLLDLTETTRGRAITLNLLDEDASPFDAWRLRLFAEGRVADHVQVFTQFQYEESDLRTVGAYLLFTPDPDRDFHVMAGKIPWLIGTYASRTYSNRNPLIGTPLMYQYHTTLRSDQLVPDADALLALAGRGQDGVDYGVPPSSDGWSGQPVVDDYWWDFGAMVTGSRAPFEYALGFVNGAPGATSAAVDLNGGKSLLGRVGLSPVTGVRLGVSAGRGPYLQDKALEGLPTGLKPGDYDLRLVMGDAELEYGHAELRAEGFRNTWPTPTLGDLGARGFYVEGKYALLAGLYAAGRWETMSFTHLRGSDGGELPWDADRKRLELGMGYRLARGMLAKAIYQKNLSAARPGAAGERVDELFATQLSMSF